MSSQLPDLDRTIYGSQAAGHGERVSFRLGKLDEEAAADMYAAYGVSTGRYRGKKLSTPALIARFSRLSQTSDSIVSRADVISADLAELKQELSVKPGVGSLGSAQLFDRLGRSLLISTDGYVPSDQLAQGAAAEAALQALLDGDHAMLRDAQVRLESDDTIEWLMGDKLDLDNAIAGLVSRGTDPLFIGAIAMMVARIEHNKPEEVATVLDRLLKGAPKGISPQMDAVARAILELRAPECARRHISAMVALWNQPNFLLDLTNLSDLLDEVAFPAVERFSLMEPLIPGEETDDWREKYWLYPDLPGRDVTPFAQSAARAVREDPGALIPVLLEMFVKGSVKHKAIASGLLREAAPIAPQIALSKSWALRLKGNSEPFGIVKSSVPAATAEFLGTMPLDTAETSSDVVCFLMQIAVRARHEMVSSLDVRQAIIAVADRLATHLKDPAHKARTIIARLLQESDDSLERELITLWPAVSDEDYWFAVEAVGTQRLRLIENLLKGADARRNAGQLVASMPDWLFPDFDNSVVPSLWRYAELGVENSRNVARAIEGFLYASKRLENTSTVWNLARKLASSTDEETRRPLIYFAGSPCRNDAARLNVDRRDTLLGILVDHENGSYVDLLAWKIIESAQERPNPVQHLVRFSERVGKMRVMKGLDKYHFLPGAKSICELFERTLREGSCEA